MRAVAPNMPQVSVPPQFSSLTLGHIPLALAAAVQGDEPKVAVEETGEGATGGEENVDCVTAKERVKKCDVTCPLGSPSVQSLKGHEVNAYKLYMLNDLFYVRPLAMLLMSYDGPL